MRPSSEELGNRLQTPTLIGCIFLTNLQWHPLDFASCFACFAAISEALNYDTFWKVLSNFRVSTDLLRCCFRFGNQLLGVFSRASNSIPSFDPRSIRKLFFFPFLYCSLRSLIAAAVFSRAIDYSTGNSVRANAMQIFSRSPSD